MRGRFIEKIPVRSILFLSYLLVIIIVTGIVSIYFYYNNSVSNAETTNKYAYSNLNELEARLDSIVADISYLSYGVSSDSDLIYQVRNFQNQDLTDQIATQQQINKLIDNYWKLKSEVLNITVFIPNMKYIGSIHNSIAPLEQVQNADWFKNINGVSGILVENRKLTGYSINPFNCVTALTQITDQNQKSLGYVTVDLDENYIYNTILSKNKITPNSIVYVINNKGNIISSYDKGELGRKLKDGNMDKILEKSQGGYFKQKIRGSSYLVVCSNSGKTGWRTIEYIPVSELYTGSDKIRKGVIIIIIMALLAALPLSVYLSTYITKPIINLSEIMSSFRQSDIDVKIPNNFTNEIGVLYTSYNTMLNRLDKLINDIKESNEFIRQSEIKLLQAQINPHFLYNTLDSISWSALSKDVPEISEMVVMLSKFYRLSLNRGQAICTVMEEINNVKYYVELQKNCFNSCFDYFIEADKETENLYIPKLILQPIIENSIVHGFERKKLGGKIHLRIFILDEKLIFEVEDNGKGMDRNRLTQITNLDSKSGGYGIKNVNERIKYICGAEYGLSYLAAENEGTVVKVTLPVVKDRDFFDKA